MSVTLFGVGSPIVVDVEESCLRAGWSIEMAVRNVPPPVYVSDVLSVREVTPGLVLSGPVLLPLFSPANRRFAWEQAVSLGASAFPALVDPTAILPRRIEIGEGVYINAGCTLGAASRLGRFAFVNRGACLGHHLALGAFASIGPGAVIAGQVTIGDDAMIGAGAVILPGITIGAGAVVGAGVVVDADVPEGATRRTRRAA
jgi:bifunctional N-acetylglucosamine-1-phosphate-uridyltransferase/glucosamine-1-phosphate-acetyltransferase GlmU-like protein